MKRDARGFTLIEMLVALAIFSVIAVSVQTVLRSGLRVWRAGNAATEAHQSARNFFNLLGRDPQNAIDYGEDAPFAGSAKRLSFMTLERDWTAPQRIAHLARVTY